MSATTAKDYMSRKEAASYLSSLGYPIAASTLARLAGKRKGPPYTRFLKRIVIYERSELERWAATQRTRFEPGKA